jgi:hypothetical protein
MASVGTRAAAAALLLSLSAVLLFLLLQTPPRGLADHVAAALDCFLDWRGLLELATRRNMVLLCHAILLVILRDAGVLGTPAGRRSQSRSRSPAPAAVAQQTASSVAPARPHATRSAVVVWRRRPRNRAAGAAAPRHDAVAARRRLVECQPAVETWAAPPPLLTTGSQARATEEAAAAVATEQQIVLAQPPRNEDEPLDHRGRDAVVGPPAEHPTAIIAVGCDDRRIATDDENGDGNGMEMIAASPHARRREQQTAGMEMELADDKTFEEFIKSQRRQMRQESLKLLISSGKATTTTR